jgi:AraC family transcriptional regulator
MHGVNPSQARADGVMLKAYPKMSFQLSIKGEKEMDYRIENKEAFQVFGIEGVFDVRVGIQGSGDDTNLRKPADLWEESHVNGAYEKLAADAGEVPAFVGKDLCNVHAICDYRETEKDTFPYMLCAFRGAGSKITGYTVADIPAHTWAIFPSVRCPWSEFGAVIGGLYKRIYSEWMPTSNYEQLGSLDMEIYGGDEDTAYVEIWVAVRKKEV